MPRKNANGLGSVYRRAATGKYEAVLTIDGRRVTRVRTTRREAQQALTELRALREQPQRRPLTVAEYLSEWLEISVKPSVRASTWTSYEHRMRCQVVPHLGAIDLTALTGAQVQTMIAANLKAGIAASTLRGTLTVLRSALKQAEMWELIDKNPARFVRPPRLEDAPPPALTPDIARAILAAVAGQRIGPAITVALYLGLRKGELLGLRWRDIDERAGTLTVAGQLVRAERHEQPKPVAAVVYTPPKTASSVRTVPLIAPVVAALTTAREMQTTDRLLAGTAYEPSGYVFTDASGGPLGYGLLRLSFRKALADAGLPPMRLHDLRHGAASLLAAEGVEVKVRMQLLGHTRAETALKYSHVTFDQLRDGLERLGDRLESE